MSIHEDLGVRRLVNADSMKTSLGGSLMHASVSDAMREAASAYVDMFELQAAVSKRIARLTKNEAALVCTGASTGLILSTLACMTGSDLGLVWRLLDKGPEALPRREVIVQCGQRNPYDASLKVAGGRIVQIGNVLQTFPWELEGAITDQTVAVFYFAGGHLGYGCLELDDVIRIAHEAGVPVVVDAAAQLPPRENLWRFTQRGADLVIFSGGKELRGPQASGLVVGRADLVEACATHASPHQRFGRAMKVGKEEMIGLLVAIERYLAQDEAEERAGCERTVEAWIDKLCQLPGVTARRDFPGTDARPLPRAIVTFETNLRLSGQSVHEALLAAEPAVAVAIAAPDSVYLNPELLDTGEDAIVLEALVRLVRDASRDI
jgi:L-seryl-tRNA(Ser) seleniumtransferase